MIGILYLWPEKGSVRYWAVKEDKVYNTGVYKNEEPVTENIHEFRDLMRTVFYAEIIRTIKSRINITIRVVKTENFGGGDEVPVMEQYPINELVKLFHAFDYTWIIHRDKKAWSDNKHAYRLLIIQLNMLTYEDRLTLYDLLNEEVKEEVTFNKYFNKYFRL